MAKGSLRVNGIIVDADGEIKASTGDAIVIREDDGSSVITVDTGGRALIGSTFTADANFKGNVSYHAGSDDFIRLRNSSLIGKLSMKPGKILFILILSFAYLSEYILVKADKPDLNTPDVGKFCSGSKTANVEIFIIEPFFCFCIIGVMILAALTTFK